MHGMTLDEMKRRYGELQEQLSKLEARREEAVRRGERVPGGVDFALTEVRISAEELRMWGNRELTRQLREARA